MERRIYIIQDLPKMGNGIPRSAEFIQEGFKTYLGVPMMVKGSLKGVLEIFQRDEFTPAEGCLCFLKIVAGEVAIALDNSQMLKSLQRSACELDIAYDATIEGWLQALNYREIETKEHIRRVAEMAVCLAERMGVNESQIIHIWRGAMLHDIGKMGIAESILLKPGPLSYQEREIIHGYPKIAYDLLAPIKYLQPALDIPYCFHEKWDGTGYPRGLKGNQIPQAARLFAIIHMWDVLLFDRPYRRAWPEKKVRQYLREQEGTHFDPNIVELFFQFLDVQRLR